VVKVWIKCKKENNKTELKKINVKTKKNLKQKDITERSILENPSLGQKENNEILVKKRKRAFKKPKNIFISP